MLKSSRIPLLPDPPMDEDDNSVEVPSHLLGNCPPCREPPVFCAVKAAVRDGEIHLRPLFEKVPKLLGKTAVNKKVVAALWLHRTKRAIPIGRPTSFLKIICRKALPMYDKPHEEFATRGRFGFPQGFVTSKPDSSHEEHLISTADCELVVFRPAPLKSILSLRIECSCLCNVPEQ